MIFRRITAVVIFLQGVSPALLLGVLRPGGWFLLCAAVVYTLLAGGLWTGRRWALPSTFAVTLPQLFILSSQLFSWRFYVGASYGEGIGSAPRFLDMPLFSFHSVGGAFNWAFFRYNSMLLSEFYGTRSDSFLCFNVVAMFVLGFLVGTLVLQLRASRPNNALQRTEAGVEPISSS